MTLEDTKNKLSKMGFNNEQVNFLLTNSDAVNALQENGWLPKTVSKKMKVKQTDGSFSTVYFGTSADLIDTDNGESLTELLTWDDNYITI